MAQSKKQSPKQNITRYQPVTEKSVIFVHGGGSLKAKDMFNEGEKDHLVIIPTAKKNSDNMEEKLDRMISKYTNQGFKRVTILDISAEEANQAGAISCLDEASAVFIMGGYQSKLVGHYAGTLVEEGLQRFIARGGVLLGSSAGAAIMSETRITVGKKKSKLGTGFGLLPKEIIIDQHFSQRNRQSRLLDALKKHPSKIGFGVDEGTAIKIRGDEATVVGESSVTVMFANGKREKFATGSTFNIGAKISAAEKLSAKSIPSRGGRCSLPPNNLSATARGSPKKTSKSVMSQRRSTPAVTSPNAGKRLSTSPVLDRKSKTPASSLKSVKKLASPVPKSRKLVPKKSHNGQSKGSSSLSKSSKRSAPQVKLPKLQRV